jgi:phage terminase small subunit
MDNESPKGNEKNLNWRQSKFVAEFVEHGNATQAAQAAGYSHPKQQGSRLLTHVDVKAAIEAHKRQMMVKTLDKGIESIEHLWRMGLDEDIPAAVRARCFELVAKANGQFIERQQIETVSSGFFADLEPEDDLPENVLPFKSETCGD